MTMFPFFVSAFSFVLVSGFAISISMFWLVAITSFPSWELVEFFLRLRDMLMCFEMKFQLFHLHILHLVCYTAIEARGCGRDDWIASPFLVKGI